jgi:hypothetical protein
VTWIWHPGSGKNYEFRIRNSINIQCCGSEPGTECFPSH